jgi:uncharacterized protein (TIGR02996 family)
VSSLSVLLTALLDHSADEELRARLRTELLHAGGWDWPVLLGFVLDNPAADGPRLLAADWLEDHDEADRAEFTRAQCRLLQMLDVYGAGVMAEPEAAALTSVVRGLTPELLPGLAADLLPPGEAATDAGDGTLVKVACRGVALEYVRGFVGRVEMAEHDFLDGAGELFAREPVVVVRLTDKEPVPVRNGWWWADTCLAPSDPAARARHVHPELYAELLRPGPGRSFAPAATAAELTFPTREKALAALSVACVRYGRAAAGLRRVA